MRSTLFAALLLLFTQSVKSQVAISYFPFESVLSVATNTEKLVWADYKLLTNTFFSNLNMELSPKINISRRTVVNYYIGPGVSFNLSNGSAGLSPVNGYFLDIGARIKPLSKLKQLQVIFELSPYANRIFSGGNLRTRLGIAYHFYKYS